MNQELRSSVVAAAEAIHLACASVANGSAGNCKEATLALALALEPLEIPIAICQGTVVVSGSEHDHYWCRIAGSIVDPTADQFGNEAGPLIADESSLPHYREESFFVFTPAAIGRLARAAGLIFPQRPRVRDRTREVIETKGKEKD